MTTKERHDFIQSFRNGLANSVTLDIFSKLGGNKIEVLKYIPFIKTELLTLKNIDEEKLNKILESTIELYNNREEQILNIISNVVELGYTKTEIQRLIFNGRVKCLKEYKRLLRNYTTWASQETIECVMRILDEWNIFIINDSLRLPIQFCDLNLYDKNKKNIILLNLEGIGNKSAPHFELLCERVEYKGKIYDRTIFDSSHPLMEKIFQHLCNI